jgi:hypothetical protein
MSAYIVVEGTVRDKEALGRYGSEAIPSIKQFGGEVLAFGPWELIFGEAAYHNGMIVRFADKDTAPIRPSRPPHMHVTLGSNRIRPEGTPADPSSAAPPESGTAFRRYGRGGTSCG